MTPPATTTHPATTATTGTGTTAATAPAAAAAAAAGAGGERIRLGGLDLDALTEPQVITTILTALAAGHGGWVATPNTDITRAARRDPALAALIATAALAVPDGMPLIWAARLAGHPLPGRVTGASLIHTLTTAAAARHHSIYLLGGPPGTPQQAARNLTTANPGLRIAGTSAPPPGFDTTPAALDALTRHLTTTQPDIVYVGLGFPRQEHLITHLTPHLPRTWFIACGAAIPFAAGTLHRAPPWMQNTGLEWLHRLATEPRRLFRRYIIHDLPYATHLLTTALFHRLTQAELRG